MGGSGLVDPTLYEFVGSIPTSGRGSRSAWGSSESRSPHNVTDVRLLWENDLRFLRQF